MCKRVVVRVCVCSVECDARPYLSSSDDPPGEGEDPLLAIHVRPPPPQAPPPPASTVCEGSAFIARVPAAPACGRGYTCHPGYLPTCLWMSSGPPPTRTPGYKHGLPSCPTPEGDVLMFGLSRAFMAAMPPVAAYRAIQLPQKLPVPPAVAATMSARDTLGS